MRRRFVTTDMVDYMKRMESKMSRIQIARELKVEPSTVTKHLGPVRSYKGNRVKI